MPPNWRLKTLGTIFLVLLSVYYLIPTMFNFDRRREDAEKNQQPLPTYMKFFPKEQIKMGLDLQGGIYVEMEVEEEDALKNRADILSSEITRLTQSETFAPELVSRDSEGTNIKITLKKEEDRSSLDAWIRQNYRDVLEEKKDL